MISSGHGESAHKFHISGSFERLSFKQTSSSARRAPEHRGRQRWEEIFIAQILLKSEEGLKLNNA